MALNSQKVIRAALGQGGRLFPALAGRLAFELFCRTDDPARPAKKEQAAIDRAAPIMAEARRHRLKISTGCVVAHQFRASQSVPHRGKALVIHGWRSRTDFMARMIASLADAGFDVVGLDLPGHGLSTGRTLNVKRGVEAVQAAATWLGPFDFAIGHSFGGVVAVNAAIGGIKNLAPVPFARIAIIASPNSMPEMFKGVGGYFGLGSRAQAAMERRIHTVAGHPVETFVMSEQLKRFDGGVLVCHAPDDREVSFAGAEAMASAGDHVRLMPFEGLGHRRIIADETVFAALKAFAAGRADVAAAA
jgi:pimeloyl-ACP methyl ester carboxylesterase